MTTRTLPAASAAAIKLLDCIGDKPLLFLRKLSMHREGEDFQRGLLSHRKITRLSARHREGLLQMERDGIVDRVGDAPPFQVIGQRVTFGGPERVLVENVFSL